MFAACQGVMTVASRIVYSFARDRGLGQLSPYLERVHPKLLVPAWSIIFSSIWVVVFGLICEY
jgi:amino acid transporter